MSTLTTFIQHSIGSPSHSNQCDKVAVEKINTQKSVALLETNIKRLKREIKETSHLPLHQKE